jgi:organic radical activating enzyme
MKANLIEIFASIQGEGPYVGEPMTFVRFQNCALSCRYCDTPDSFKKLPEFRLEAPAGSGEFLLRPNPLEGHELSRLLRDFPASTLSLTGGEPLQHGEFLQAWLPELAGRYRILLETNGVLPRELAGLIDSVDIVSMDIKLPSVTGMKAYWEEHGEFLKIARKKDAYVKVVLSKTTDGGEFQQAVAMVKKYAPEIPFILQPVTPHGPVTETIGEDRLEEFYDLSRASLPDVRVIPQIHPLLGVL